MKIKIEKGFWKEFLKVFVLNMILAYAITPVQECYVPYDYGVGYDYSDRMCRIIFFPPVSYLYHGVTLIAFTDTLLFHGIEYATTDGVSELLRVLITSDPAKLSLIMVVATITFLYVKNKRIPILSKIRNTRLKTIILYLMVWLIFVTFYLSFFLPTEVVPGFIFP